MSEVVLLILAVIAGAGLGVFYFGGLWWTVQKGVTAQNPACLFLASLIARTVIVLVGFYLVAQGHWPGLAAALIGFMMARVLIVRRLTHPPAHPSASVEEEAKFAP